jgi:hypothetical protein
MKYLWTILLAICISGTVFGQNNNVLKSSNPLKVGAYTGIRFSTFSNDAKLEEHGFTFSGTPDFGASVYFPLHKKNPVGLTADILLANFQDTYTAGNAKTEYTRTFSYLMIVPGINFENVTFGIGIGIPMGYHRHNNVTDTEEEESWSFYEGGATNPTTVQGDGKSGMNLIIEPRLGYSFPVMVHSGSQLNVNAHIGLMMSNVFKDEYYPTSNLQSFNGTMMSVALGVQYMFAL